MNFIFFSNRKGGKIVLRNDKKSTLQVKEDSREGERGCVQQEERQNYFQKIIRRNQHHKLKGTRGRERVCATGREASSTPVESSLGLLANRATALLMHSMQTKYLLGDQRY